VHRTAHGPEQYKDWGSLRAWVDSENIESLAYTNAEIEEVSELGSHRGFHVVRDPRDVLVSGYCSHLHSHPTEQWPELEKHRKALQSLSKEEGLLKEIEFSRPFLKAMHEWNYEQPHILELKMEDLTASPQQHFREILQHCTLWQGQLSPMAAMRQHTNRVLYALHHRVSGTLIPFRGATEPAIDPNILDSILEDKRFEKMAEGRSKGEENRKSHYRKGEPGDWENHFTDRVAQSFEAEYGGIVSKLGYTDAFSERTHHQQ
jgi:hypothetical protein